MQGHNRNVLVTGGAGFIGSHTAKALAKNGYNPVTIDNLVYGHRWAVQWGPFYELDIADVESVKRVIVEEKINSIIHFAAFAYVGESVQDPRKYFHNNVNNSIALIDAAMETGVNKIVFSSSCATYGMTVSPPIRESSLQSPINPYGESKLFIEKAFKYYDKAYNLKSAVLRYFNAAGADPEGHIGEVHKPETHLIPLTLFAAMKKGPELKVFGNDYNTEDGTAIRDYVHVSDLADAHVKALNALNKGNDSLVLNLGGGRGYSVIDIITAVESVTGLTVPRSFAERRSGDPPMLIADTSLVNQVLDWQPKYNEIELMIETAYKFYLGMEKM